jgi:photosystem II stability/assembly factor-like uncharacterized protein
MAMSGADDALFCDVTYSRILITHNGGNTVDSVTLADPLLTDVFFAGPKLAYAIGHFFWRSDDAGDHWTRVVDNNQTDFKDSFKSLFFLDEQTGWIAGGDGIYKTVDSGYHWTLQSTPGFEFSTPTAKYGNIHFFDAMRGFCSSPTSFGSSLNAGIDWVKRFNMQTFYHDIHFINADTGYITDKEYIWKTTDGGNNWRKEVVLPGKKILELHFTDANHGWAVGPGFLLRYVK